MSEVPLRLERAFGRHRPRAVVVKLHWHKLVLQGRHGMVLLNRGVGHLGWSLQFHGSGSGVYCLGCRVQVLGFEGWGLGFGVKSLGFRVWGVGFGVRV